MEKDLLPLFSQSASKDIFTYISIAMDHCNRIISTLEVLSKNDNERDHIEHILKECLYYQKELQQLHISLHDFSPSSHTDFNNNYHEQQLLVKDIKDNIVLLFNIEEELISDYPDMFFNHDGNWTQFELNKPSLLPHQTSSPSTQKIKKLRFKDFYFGLFFLLPIFLLFIIYLWVNDTFKVQEQTTQQPIKYEYDRAYKNLFYIYSAVLSNKTSDDNFYNLIKNNKFVIPEGFVVIDKNVIVDFYLKEYYSIEEMDTDPDVTIVSVNNLSYTQCQHILTKFSGMHFYNIILNTKPFISSLDNKADNMLKTDYNTCLSDNKNNTISLVLKKQ